MKHTQQLVKMNNSVKINRLKRLTMYFGVLSAAIAAIVVLASSWNAFYENKDHKWDVPKKKAAFPADTDANLSDIIKAGIRNITDNVKGDSSVQKQIGTVNVIQGDNDAAIDNYNNAIEKDPNNANLYLQRGSAYLMKGDIDAGIQDLEMAAYLNPNYKPLMSNAKLLRSRMREEGVNRLNKDDISKIVNATRPEDVERYAESIGYRLDDRARAALRERMLNSPFKND